MTYSVKCDILLFNMSELISPVEPTPKNLGKNPSNIHPRGGLKLWTALAAVLALGVAGTQIAQADEGYKFVDDGRFPQCTEVTMADNAILYQHPLDFPAPFTGHNPQIRHAIATMYMNGLYDIVSIKLLPQGTSLRFPATALEYRCLPDSVQSPLRYIIQMDEWGAVGLPTGWGSDGIVEVDLPEGRNLIVANRMGERHPGSGREEMEWLLFNVEGDITLRNSDGSFSVTARGPLALPSARGSHRLIEFVTPARGFADDTVLYPH